MTIFSNEADKVCAIKDIDLMIFIEIPKDLFVHSVAIDTMIHMRTPERCSESNKPCILKSLTLLYIDDMITPPIAVIYTTV